MSGTAAITTFDGTDIEAGTAAIESLNIQSGDDVRVYTIGSKVYVIRYEP